MSRNCGLCNVRNTLLHFPHCKAVCDLPLCGFHNVFSIRFSPLHRSSLRSYGRLMGGLIPVDYAKVASGYGLVTYTAKSVSELKAAVEDAKKQKTSTLIDLKVIPKTMSDGYNSWWNVGIAMASEKPEVMKAAEGVNKGRSEARMY